MELPETSERTLGDTSFGETLRLGSEALGLPVTPEQQVEFERLCGWLIDWNQRMNLTAVREPADIAVKHILDSMTCLKAFPFPPGARVIDVGTGAGFPGLVLRILRPDLDLTLLDSTQKKLAFVDYVIGEMAWTNVRAIAGRAEEAAHEPEHRERYDIVLARAVAAMRVLAEFCLPFAHPGGAFLAMKGPSLADEMRHARSGIARLGGSDAQVVPFDLPFGGGARAIVVVRKALPTPRELPRIYRDIKRSPL